MTTQVTKIDKHVLSLSNLEKDLYPAFGFSKAHVLEYYRRVAEFILPHLQNRALTLKRYPNGAGEEYFFEKRCPAHRPSWVPTAQIPQEGGEDMTVCLVNDLATLMWVENLASLELHVPLARSHTRETPDTVVFDLDPGAGAGILECLRVSLILRDLLAELKLTCFAKTSGLKGLHVYVPLNQIKTTFEDTKHFSRSVAEVLERNYPDLVTSKMARGQRTRKVFINWSQNDASKTTVCVYSLRAGEKPTVSCPRPWNEIEKFVEKGDARTIGVLPFQALDRLSKTGDLFAPVLTLRQELPHV
ncbi:MAG: ATP-dependent DNA ligase [Deltaproteobacteria bacterium]|nr:ATP-dependent DNA ligase [Deltaproteobacteria bacterium]